MTSLFVSALSVAFAALAVAPQATATQPPPKPTQQVQSAQPPPKPPSTATQPPVKTVPPTVPPKTPVPAAPQAKPAAVPAAGVGGRLSLLAFITDPAGKPLADVKVSALGPVSREGASDRDGIARLTALRAGTYRLRFESKETVTFEREAVLKAGPTSEVEVTLNPAPPPPPTPPAPVPLAASPEPIAAEGPFRFELLSLPDWIERNYIGRNDPLKEGLVGALAGATAKVLQVRDPIKDRLSRDTDELLYVIAGDGVVTLGGRQENLTAGWLVVIPRGTPSVLERRGRNPLIVLVVTAPAKR